MLHAHARMAAAAAALASAAARAPCRVPNRATGRGVAAVTASLSSHSPSLSLPSHSPLLRPAKTYLSSSSKPPLRDAATPRVPVRAHGSHSRHDATMLAGSAAGRSATSTVLAAGLLSDATLTAVKGAAGLWSGSAGLLSDALHSAADMLISVSTIVTTRFAAVRPDHDHPYGHGRLDSLGALVVASLLTGAGASMGWKAAVSAVDLIQGVSPQPLLELLGPMSPEVLARPEVAFTAIAACAVSVVIKEYVYRWTMRVGMALRSQALIANAWHHRADSWTSLVAALGIGGSMAGVPLLDPLAGLAVAGMVAATGVRIASTALEELMDKRLDNDVIAAAVDIARMHADVRGVRNVRARRMGPSVLLDMECAISPHITAAAADVIAGRIRERLFTEQPHVSECLLHFAPADAHDGWTTAAPARPGSHQNKAHVEPVVEPAPAATPAPAAAADPSDSPVYSFDEITDNIRATLLRVKGVRAVSKLDIHVESAAEHTLHMHANVVIEPTMTVQDAQGVLRRAASAASRWSMPVSKAGATAGAATPAATTAATTADDAHGHDHGHGHSHGGEGHGHSHAAPPPAATATAAAGGRWKVYISDVNIEMNPT